MESEKELKKVVMGGFKMLGSWLEELEMWGSYILEDYIPVLHVGHAVLSAEK